MDLYLEKPSLKANKKRVNADVFAYAQNIVVQKFLMELVPSTLRNH